MKKNDLNEISTLIKERIKNFINDNKNNSVVDTGVVISVADGIALIYGLDKVKLGEKLLFPNGVSGMVMDLNKDYVGAILFSNENLVKAKDIVKRTYKTVEVPVGDELLGHVIDPLGNLLDENKVSFGTCEFRPIEKEVPGIIEREKINEPLLTGTKIIDALIPIGKGQRELIIGDRETGKTSLAISAIINQKDKNVKCIYVAIGQKNSFVKGIYQKLKKFDALKYTVIVNASADKSSSIQYIAPYAGMSIAEYWLDKKEDVLVIFDDLSKHAIAYRTISLLLKRPSGRESYPGDIFYLHSRLLERGCKLKKGGSITILPIVETQNNDISGYIPTNIISITDGQIVLTTDNFNAGFLPAIDINLSISRVGSDAQFSGMKLASKFIKEYLIDYNDKILNIFDDSFKNNFEMVLAFFFQRFFQTKIV